MFHKEQTSDLSSSQSSPRLGQSEKAGVLAVGTYIIYKTLDQSLISLNLEVLLRN